MSYQNNLLPSDAEAVTPGSTSVNYVGLYVGGSGNVVVKTGGGSSVTFQSVPAGTILPLRVVEVSNTSTATLMVGFKA